MFSHTKPNNKYMYNNNGMFRFKRFEILRSVLWFLTSDTIRPHQCVPSSFISSDSVFAPHTVCSSLTHLYYINLE